MSDQMPVGPQPEFKSEALEANFKYVFTRKQCIILVNALRPIQLPIGDLRRKVLGDLLDQIENTAISSIKQSDYMTAPAQPQEVITK